MPPPCNHISNSDCRLCWLYANDDRYRKLWDEIPPIPASPLPSLIRSAINYTRAYMEHLAAGKPIITEEQREVRLAMCRGGRIPMRLLPGQDQAATASATIDFPKCDRYNAETDRCHHLKCGCYMEEKTWWGEQQCPDNPPKWGPILPETGT